MNISRMSCCLYLPIVCLWWMIPFTFSLARPKETAVYSKQNKSFFFPKYRPEIFYDNKVLPEDIEVDVFVFEDQLQRLFYVLDGSYRPLSITVTPCSSSLPLEWRLSYQPLPASAATASYGGGKGDNSRRPKHQSQWNKYIHRPQSVIPASPSASYAGKERRSYTSSLAPPGLYTLELSSATTTQAKVVVTTRSCTDFSYHPTLPAVKNVQIVKAKRNRVLISWRPSSSKKPVDYCVTSNTAENYHSFCSANLDLLSAHLLAPPVSSGFGFQWEKASKKTITSNFVTDIPKNNASIVCVGRKTWHMFKGLERGKTYYFDVFALDSENNASTAYVGVKAMIKPSQRHSWVREDTLLTFTLDGNNGYSISAKYAGGKNASDVLIFVQSCSGPGPVEFIISRATPGSRPRAVLSERIMDIKTLQVPQSKDARNSTFPYILNLRSTTEISRKVRIWLSTKKHLFPFPILPSDKYVKVFDTLITCDSITIGWKASPDERVKYCIYRSAVRDDLMRKTLAEPQNFCQAPVEVNEDRTTVLCRRYHRFSKRRFNNVIMQRVRGLEPGMTYLFEVQVTKVKGNMLPYERVWASTRKKCTRTRSKR